MARQFKRGESWLKPLGCDIELSSAQNAIFEAVKDVSIPGARIESTTNQCGPVAWAQCRVVCIEKNVVVLVKYFTSNKFSVETGWDNELSDATAQSIRARLAIFQEDLA